MLGLINLLLAHVMSKLLGIHTYVPILKLSLLGNNKHDYFCEYLALVNSIVKRNGVSR